jgi:uncharacterized cupredoxin-like copper-binding protein
VLTATGLLAACGGDSHDHESASGDEAGQTGSGGAEAVRSATYGQGAGASEATRSVKVTMSDDFRFSPAEIVVNRGEVITFRITNLGSLTHDFTIGGPDAQRLHGLEMAMGEGGGMAAMDHGTMEPSHGSMGHTSTDRSAAEQARLIAELDEKVAFFTSVHVMPGETKEVTWALTGPRAPLIGCHVPGHWDKGMRGAVVWG